MNLFQKTHNRSFLLTPANSFYRESLLEFTVGELKRDTGCLGDITSNALFPKKKKVRAKIITRESGIFAGEQEVKYFLSYIGLKVSFLKHDGESVKANDVLAVITGNIRDILKAERVVLNLIGRMSGVATATHNIVKKVNKNVLITPTRKTLRGLLDKRACALGGGGTHRLNLSDAILIKDNHLDALDRDIGCAIRKCFPLKKPAAFVEIEVENKKEAAEAFQEFKKLQDKKLCGVPCFIMFDNMAAKGIKEALALLKKKGLRRFVGTEASGGINGKNVANYAKTGVDIISMGSITHSARMMDVSLET